MANTNVAQDFKTAADRAYDLISQGILTGELTPGSRLSRRRMAAMVGVSVIPITEAVRRLESDGLVESRPHWGTRVVELSEAKTRDVYALREAIECQVVFMLTGKLSRMQLDHLRHLAEQLGGIWEQPEKNLVVSKLHYELHLTMAEYTGCNSLKDALHRVNLYRLLRGAFSRRKARRPALPSDWHTRIILALEGNDPDKSVAMMREHVRDSLVRDGGGSS